MMKGGLPKDVGGTVAAYLGVTEQNCTCFEAEASGVILTNHVQLYLFCIACHMSYFSFKKN